MKTHKFIFAFLSLSIAIVVVNACSTNDLELVNPNQLSPETFFKTEAQIQSAANSVYANLQTGAMWTRGYFFQHDLMGGDASGNPQLEADKGQYLAFSFDANHGHLGGYWESCYRGINKCNFVLDNADAINASSLTQALKDKYLGEAKFMRALYNFLLVIRFGDMPLITTTPTSTAGIGKSPKADVYAAIIADLQSASTTLLSKTVEQKGRATSEAAIALLGKVYLYLGEHQLALNEFVKLNGKFTLETNYYNNFRDESEFGPESIFEIQYDTTINNNPWISDVSGGGAGEATLRGQEYGFNDWFNTYPNPALVAAYEPGDIRHEETFYTEGDLFESNGKIVRVGVAPNPVPATDIYIPLQRTAAWRKYQNYYKRANEANVSSINFKYMRYADVLLMMAECENQRPGGNQTTAVGYINTVRARAGLAPIAAGTQAQVFEAIVQERRVELAGEQLRFSDLIRWGRASTELAGQGFQSPKNLLWPIPQREFNSNEALSPSDQNPGY
jgi:starch-binding outer membrane protein, SusD/RagB family